MPDSDPELEELRRRRLQQLAQQQGQLQEQQQMQQLREKELDAQIKTVISKILTPEARSRLGNIRVVKPDFARQVEVLLIQLYQAGRLPTQVNDAQLKDILSRLSSSKRDTKIVKK